MALPEIVRAYLEGWNGHDGAAVEGVVVAGDRLTMQWRMLGTHAGPLPGFPEPTGGRCDLPGVDVMTLGPDGIRSIVGYFDRQTLVEQLSAGS